MSNTPVAEAYIELLKRSLLGETVGRVTMLKPVHPFGPPPPGRRARVARMIDPEPYNAVWAEPFEVDLAANAEGAESAWTLPPWPMTMIGRKRLEFVEQCIRDVVAHGVPGDVIETGVWRGGTTIFMRGLLRGLGVTDRKVYVADSFEGVPPPDPGKYPADAGITLHEWENLAIGLDEVRGNFERYGLLDDQVEFLKGWFRDTLPGLKGHRWAVLRLDGDLYESTMDSLDNLYGGLSAGGWLIVDDYEIPACAKAVNDFRDREGVTEPIVTIDWTGIAWQKR